MSPKQVREFRSELEKFEILKTLNMSLLLRHKIWKSAVKRFDNHSLFWLRSELGQTLAMITSKAPDAEMMFSWSKVCHLVGD